MHQRCYSRRHNICNENTVHNANYVRIVKTLFFTVSSPTGFFPRQLSFSGRVLTGAHLPVSSLFLANFSPTRLFPLAGLSRVSLFSSVPSFWQLFPRPAFSHWQISLWSILLSLNPLSLSSSFPSTTSFLFKVFRYIFFQYTTLEHPRRHTRGRSRIKCIAAKKFPARTRTGQRPIK